MRRRVTFVAKAEYFDDAKTAWFFKSCGQIPIRREGGSASERALASATEVLRSRQGLRDLPGRHAHARRPAAPRPHGRGPARDGVQRPDHSGRSHRHRRRAADRFPATETVPPRHDPVRRADRSGSLRGPRARPHGATGAHRRGDVRDQPAFGVRVRRHVRHQARRGHPHRDGAHRELRRRTRSPFPRPPEPGAAGSDRVVRPIARAVDRAPPRSEARRAFVVAHRGCERRVGVPARVDLLG